MTIRMSIARCCCVVGCARATCQLDTFDTYGTGNSILTGSIWSPEAASSGTAEETASDTCLLGDSQRIYGSWGVDGVHATPSFTTGYANRTYMELDCLAFGDDLTYMAMQFLPRGVLSGTDNPSIALHIGADGGFDIEKSVIWFDVDNVAQEVIMDSILEADFTQAYIQHVYRIELYDYLQQTGSDSVSRATFQWKVLEDGVVLAESHDGTTQLESRFASEPPNKLGGDNWCETPVASVTSAGYGSFVTDTIEFDTFKLVTNGDETCIP